MIQYSQGWLIYHRLNLDKSFIHTIADAHAFGEGITALPTGQKLPAQKVFFFLRMVKLHVMTPARC